MDNLEKCARAIHDTAVRNGAFHGGWDDQPFIYQERCRNYAAAVLDEVRSQRFGHRMLVSMKAADRKVSRNLAQAFNAVRGIGRSGPVRRQVPGE